MSALWAPSSGGNGHQIQFPSSASSASVTFIGTRATTNRPIKKMNDGICINAPSIIADYCRLLPIISLIFQQIFISFWFGWVFAGHEKRDWHQVKANLHKFEYLLGYNGRWGRGCCAGAAQMYFWKQMAFVACQCHRHAASSSSSSSSSSSPSSSFFFCFFFHHVHHHFLALSFIPCWRRGRDDPIGGAGSQSHRC